MGFNELKAIFSGVPESRRFRLTIRLAGGVKYVLKFPVHEGFGSGGQDVHEMGRQGMARVFKNNRSTEEYLCFPHSRRCSWPA